MLSRRVYELLPTLYVLSGVLAVNAIDNGLAFFSGSLFTMAGVIVFNQRLAYRGKRSVFKRPVY